MADNTKIEWTDATWNPITGCSIVSPGCTNCYAMKLAGTRLQHHPSRARLTKDSKAGPVWTGEVRFNEQWLTEPLKWKRPRMIFVCAHGDLFAEGVPDEWIDKIFAIMALAPHHTFQVLTKRPERMREYLVRFKPSPILDGFITRDGIHSADSPKGWPIFSQWPLPNIWLGVSVEDQPRAKERITTLLQTPAAIRWVSAEPLIGPLNLTSIDIDSDGVLDALNIHTWGEEIANWRDTDKNWEASFLDWFDLGELPDEDDPILPRLDWVVAGGEGGRNARPMHPDWARSLRDQCAAAGVPFLFKQWGQWGPIEETVGSHEQFAISHSGKLVKSADLAYPDGKARSSLSEEDRPGLHSMYSVGKKAAGRLLDGVEHNGFPEVQS
ncbi:phage Gp37/Gp68 family protein [Agrobacterium vitis]|uniref:phage Gp37/Gp68 family protein n=1 Tax=Agrobacterium vitis TaxID=373 RepID=UPI001F320DD0|nr:phage Gp37/Gp68 family protein [Agrobacterium vitis]MCF1498940.1 phage Gp37/Gp68 family protein [Allorhizobium sp. Av2]MCM2441157.1 phage Gp37/Gp68 family protein [Agrobacterium vitis]